MLLEIRPGEHIIVPIGTKYCMTYDTKVSEMPTPVKAVIDTILGNFVYLKNSNVVLLLDSLCEQLATHILNEFDSRNKTIESLITQLEFEIGQLVFIPKGTFYMTTGDVYSCRVKETEYDMQGKIKDISSTYIMIENFHGLILRNELTKDNILQHNRRNSDIKTETKSNTVYINNGTKEQIKFGSFKIEKPKNSDEIKSKYNTWSNVYQKTLDNYYIKDLTDTDETTANTEAGLWIDFMEHYHNRQYKNIKEEGLN